MSAFNSIVVEVVQQGPAGPAGPSGTLGAVDLSADPNNRLTIGSDGKIFTADLLMDPLAYYILSRN
jgi:hypothetical protein